MLPFRFVRLALFFVLSLAGLIGVARADFPPTFNYALAPQTVPKGGTAEFVVSTGGTFPQTYQWYKNGVPIAGATGASYFVYDCTDTDVGDFSLQVTNMAGSVTSNAAHLTVTAAVAPTITNTLASSSVEYGGYYSPAVEVTGSAPFAYQWYFNGTPIPGATLQYYILNYALPTSAGSYGVRVTNAVGTATSNVATLTVASPVSPTITLQPVGRDVPEGTVKIEFEVRAAGSLPFTYQWFKSGTAIPGATTAFLTLPAVEANDAGRYTVKITNPGGSVTSAEAVVTVGASDTFHNSFAPLGRLESAFINGAGFLTTFSSFNSPEPDYVTRWYRDQTLVATSNSRSSSNFSISPVTATSDGSYLITTTTMGGTYSADPTEFTVRTPGYYDNSNAVTSNPNSWLAAKRQGNIVYFLFKNQLHRYDLASAQWLSRADLPFEAKGFDVGSEGVYVASASSVRRYALDLGSSTVFATSTNAEIYRVFLNDTYLFLATTVNSSSMLYKAIKRSDGSLAKETSLSYYDTLLRTYDVSSATGRVYGWRGALFPSYLMTFTLGADGSVDYFNTSGFHDVLEGYAQRFSPDGTLLLSSNGAIYQASDLSFRGAFSNGPWNDVAFFADGKSVVLRGAKVTLHDGSNFSPLGSKRLSQPALMLVTEASNAFAFTPPVTSGADIGVASFVESELVAPAATPAVTPTAARVLSFTPDDSFMDKDGLIYLLDRRTRNVLIWSPTAQTYLNSIPIRNAAVEMTYSATLHRVYLYYADRVVSYIDLGVSPTERWFTTFPSASYGIRAVDNQLSVLLSDGNSTGDHYALFASSGQLAPNLGFGSSYNGVGEWNSVKQALYAYNFGTLSAISVQPNAMTGLASRSINGEALKPFRFSTDGSAFVTGGGDVINATTLLTVASLGIKVTDAAWMGSNLYTLKTSGFGTELQIWNGSTFAAAGTKTLDGYPRRIWTLPNNQLLALTTLSSGPIFTRLNADGTVVSWDANTGMVDLPPILARSPDGQYHANPGDSVTLTADATGPNLTYQWKKNDAPLPGAVQSSLTLTNIQAADAGSYTVTITNASGSVTSQSGNVFVPPFVFPNVKGLNSQTTVVGGAVTFTADSEGAGLLFQWFHDDVAIPGATGKSFTIAAAQRADNGLYYVRVSIRNSARNSNRARLSVVLDPAAPVVPTEVPRITAQPASVVTLAGLSASFTVAATGSPAPNYQWYFNDAPIAGANSPTYVLTGVQAGNVGRYTVVASNSAGSVTSQAATLALGSSVGAPTITAQPVSQTGSIGSTVVFSVDASTSTNPGNSVRALSVGSDTAGFSYQWYFNGVLLTNGVGIAGADSSTLVLSSVGARAGSYRCQITSGSASVLSQPATLTVAATTDLGRLVNVSCRSQVGTGDDVLIAGFVVGGGSGAGTQKLLIRGAGPALTPFGVNGALPDPELKVYAGGSLLNSNRGWNGSMDLSNAANEVGAFAWPNSSSHDAAILSQLPSGVYSAVVAGQSGDTGVALVELYDNSPTSTDPSTAPRLVNISARVPVGTGGNILIAGFVVGGSTSRTVLVRATGPTLAQYGVTNVLSKPQLKLYQGTTVLASNAGWNGNAQIAGIASSVGAFAWTDPNSKDSALLITLAPGVYSAQIAGADNSTGVALIEVYEIP